MTAASAGVYDAGDACSSRARETPRPRLRSFAFGKLTVPGMRRSRENIMCSGRAESGLDPLVLALHSVHDRRLKELA